jgi:hypothetical protein
MNTQSQQVIECEKLLKLHFSLRLAEWLAFLGVFRFFSPVNGKEKDDFLKLYLPLWECGDGNQYQTTYPMVVYRIRTFMYVGESNINVCRGK